MSSSPAPSDRHAHVAATCRRCGHKLDHLVREIEWGWLERCPACNAYDWEPEPVVERRSFEEAKAAGDV